MDQLKEAPNNPFDAPVPGQSLTDKPGSAAWEHPPQYTNTADAADFVWDQLTTPEFAQQVIAMSVFLVLILAGWLVSCGEAVG